MSRATVTDIRINTGNEDADRVLQLALKKANPPHRAIAEDLRNGTSSFFLPMVWLRNETKLDDAVLLVAIAYLADHRYINFQLRGHGIDIWMRSKLVEKVA